MLLLLLLAAPSHQLPWGVIADATAYVRHDKGFDALDLAGKLRWTTKGDLRPVAEAGGVVLAYGPGKGGMMLVGLDAKTGKEKWVETVVLPDWVAVTGPTLGRSFSVRSGMDGGKLVVGYKANSWYAGGARPTPEIEKAARKEEANVFLLDPATGKREKGGELPVASSHRNGDIDFMIKAVKSGAVLMRTKGEKALAEVPLTDTALRVVVALDGKHVLIQTGTKEKRAEWRAFDSATGKEVGKLETVANLHAVDATGGRVFAFIGEGERKMPFGTFPRKVEMIDLKTGKAVWSHKAESQVVHAPPP